LRNYVPKDEKETASGGGVAVEKKTQTIMDAVFSIKVGPVGKTILDEAEALDALLVIGAYGFKDPEDNVMGSTTTQIIRSTRASVLVYR